MPLNVCDYEPCQHLQHALQKLIVIPSGTVAFQFVVISKSKPLKTFYVPLMYCPFCGTRIEEEWVESFIQQLPRRTA